MSRKEDDPLPVKVVAAPGGVVATVTLAPPATEHESKRRDFIDNEEGKLLSKMGVLRQQTLAKNREFKRQTDALEARRIKVEDRLATETEQRAQSFAKLKDNLQQALVALEADFEELATNSFTRLQTQGLDPIDEQVTATDKAMGHFFKVTVPDAIEEQSGPVVRRMLKSRESFEIENTKLRAREEYMIEKFHNHCDYTAKRFADEKSDRVRIFTNLGEQLDASFASANREEERVHTEMARHVADQKLDMERESVRREAEDNTILTNLQASMTKLQQQILDNFGGEA